MDTTLQEYVEYISSLQSQLDKYYMIMNEDQLHARVVEVQSKIKTLQSISYKLADISNSITRIINKKYKKQIEPVIDLTPNLYDIGIIEFINSEKIEIVDGIMIPCKKISCVSAIPKTALYYCEDTKQYAVNIFGITIKGNLCDIGRYGSPLSSDCKYGTQCKNLNTCVYYHDPSDYIKNHLPVPDRYRCLTSGSYIYTGNSSNKLYTRKIGDRKSIKKDLACMSSTDYRNELLNREHQLIHDLLIFMILQSEGISARYKQWPGIPKSFNKTG